MKDFSNYQFRASQVHLLMAGTIGITDKQKERIKELEARKTTYLKLTNKQLQQKKELLALGENITESKQKTLDKLIEKENTLVGLTPDMKEELKSLIEANEKKELPKTMIAELRKIHRAETYNRNFVWTNKFVQKGILQEEEAITLYQDYRKQVLGINTFFTKNTERLVNDWFSGEWDLPTLADVKKMKEGFDIKNSWSLDTFPFKDDELSNQYFYQNQVYMALTGAEKWTTVFCLVNGTEHLVNNEKQKHFYALNMPNEESDLYKKYEEKCRDVEKMMIFDYDRFVSMNPYHNMEISRDEWYGEGYDIPLEGRILEKTVSRDENVIKELQERIVIAREYLNSLNK